LVRFRLEQARESLKATGVLTKEGLYRSAVSRSYYAMFYSVLALLASEKHETGKHSGAISLFDKEFVRTGVFSKEFSRGLHEAFGLRQRCDYSAEFAVTEEDAKDALRRAEAFVEGVTEALSDVVGDGTGAPDR
jgi:uncharacterized protein (UPF0332 family)